MKRNTGCPVVVLCGTTIFTTAQSAVRFVVLIVPNATKNITEFV